MNICACDLGIFNYIYVFYPFMYLHFGLVIFLFVLMYLCMYVCMYVCMDGWMNGWMDGWMDNHCGFALRQGA